MTYSPDPFTTDGGLNSGVIRAWARQNDRATVAQWLASGNKHPRLATELIYEAVEAGHLDLAEQVWQAGWHKMPSTLEHAWGRLKTDPSRMALAPHDQLSVEWLIEKSRPLPGAKRSAAQNAGLVSGLEYAFRANNHGLWQRLFDEGAHCQGAAGYDLFITMSHYCPWFKTAVANQGSSTAWVEQQALDDLLDHGLQIGGEAWIQAMRQPEAIQLFEALVKRAEQLTTPRQRSAIVAMMQGFDILPDRKHQVEALFLQLGLTETIALTPTERKKVRSDFDIIETVLETPSRPHINLPQPQKQTMKFTNGEMSLLDAFPESQRSERRAQWLDTHIAPTPSNKPKPRF